MDGPLARKKLLTAIRKIIETLPDFEAGMLAMVHEEVRRQQAGLGQREEEWAKRQQRLGQERDHLLRAIREGGPRGVLLEELHRLEQEKTQIAWELTQARENAKRSVALPSLAEIRDLAGNALEGLAKTSLDRGRLLRQWIPRIRVYPVRLCDGGHPVLRARFTVSLASLVPEDFREGLRPHLERELEVDLFEPPQREQVRAQVMRLIGEGMSLKKIALRLGIAFPAVQRALALQQRMETLGRSDPYVRLTEPPADYTKLRRHRHRRYRFEPLSPPAQDPSKVGSG